MLVLDDNPLDRAGPWLNFARMVTLRTPKYLTGPDLGIPNLTIQRWYEAQHGDGTWEGMGLVPKETWAAYLAWYRRVLGIPVQPDTRWCASTPGPSPAPVAIDTCARGAPPHGSSPVASCSPPASTARARGTCRR